METFAAIVIILCLLGIALYGMIHEVKHMKAATQKAKEEMEFFRSFKEYLEKMEEM